MAAAAPRGTAALVATATLVGVGGCGWMRSEPTIVSRVDDGAITSTVKARLAEDATLDPGALAVETSHGNVTLSGVAKDTLSRQTAENIAIKVPGVKGVRNDITVRR